MGFQTSLSLSHEFVAAQQQASFISSVAAIFGCSSQQVAVACVHIHDAEAELNIGSPPQASSQGVLSKVESTGVQGPGFSHTQVGKACLSGVWRDVDDMRQHPRISHAGVQRLPLPDLAVRCRSRLSAPVT